MAATTELVSDSEVSTHVNLGALRSFTRTGRRDHGTARHLGFAPL